MSDRKRIKTARRGRRAVLGALALAALASPSISAGCAASFDPASRVSGLRILAVQAENDKPYAQPGEEVTFKMTFHDGYEDPEGNGVTRPILIAWLGGCFDPIGDQYFACYTQLAEVLKGVSPDPTSPDSLFQADLFLDTYTLKIPSDIISRRPTPDVGPHYGIAYIFFMACAGNLKLVPPDGTGRAPDFPLGCFDTDNKRLGPDSFVPGYTQIYAFADGRTNRNPEMAGITLDGEEMPDVAFNEAPVVQACPITAEDRRNPSWNRACGQEPVTNCTPHTLKALVDPSVAEIDPDATGEDGGELTEAVWISYFTDRGDITPGIKLVNDAVEGLNTDIETSWIPPAEPGFATIWAVLRDARGGSSVIQRIIRVE